MTERYLRYRRSETWGAIDELKDDEYRSYADGSIRRFQHKWRPSGKKTRNFVGARMPSEAEWAAFFDVIDRYDAWNWTTDEFLPVPDAASWSLRILHGERELRVDQGGGFPLGYLEVFDAIETIAFGKDNAWPQTDF